MSSRTSRAVRSGSRCLGAALCLTIAGCASVARGGYLDFEVVTEPGRGHVARADRGSVPVLHPAPLLVRDVADELPAGRTPEHRRVDLLATVPPGMAGLPAPTTRGSVHALLRVGRTPGGLAFAPGLFVDRVESDDGGAWWYDGLFVRARPAVPEVAWLVLRQERAGVVRVDGRRVAEETVHGVDRVVALRGGGPHVVEFAAWRVDVTCPPGVCVQLVETVGAAACEVSVPTDATPPAIRPDPGPAVLPRRWRLPRAAFTVDGAGRVVATPRGEQDRGLDVRLSGSAAPALPPR